MIHKNRNAGGFTLAELLITVAIIAVLVAVAIPVFNAQLEKSRQAVDVANARNAYGAAATEFLTDPSLAGTTVFFNGSELSKSIPETGYGKSSRDFASFCDALPVPVTGAPNRGGAGYITVFFGESQVESMSWGTFTQVTSPNQWMNLSASQKHELDISLRDALTNALNHMTFGQIKEYCKNSPKVEKWAGNTCYTLASSLINTETGEVWSDGKRNKIFAEELFRSIGYDTSDPQQQYIINSWGYDPEKTYNGKIDDLLIKVDIGADIAKVDPDSKPTKLIVYLNGNGVDTKNDPDFGHNRKTKGA